MKIAPPCSLLVLVKKTLWVIEVVPYARSAPPSPKAELRIYCESITVTFPPDPLPPPNDMVPSPAEPAPPPYKPPTPGVKR